ncbi:MULTISPECIES: UDP-N-acetylmuramoyl-tripeptide--D-alanyl-D-alanine ligase [Halomonadaceae]|uniref:UDP-N-acetylmuramoyl-tripeptide--D-alanyl-D-alanine ligase n=1 Tax=Modicisalibacter zincidurans TaxID=1178777 RepID=A0ABP9RHP9_9GAMM|nr:MULTISPECIES: UDP-N-acetylmuramoyl-tripeptide--D-alanyl-D-alanine ligase [Halomonas]MCD6008351.1 UDP-N-acetylmuramoyl-tripeptide--D-alanyl-D-alanine ligase [Halomonas sp. IOP_31]MEA3251291.1 UDP-N-acetylmuramoyl-tripeptide--D-alanyl-D-alanine ligase [Pseudomonadota bacterium]
MSGCGLETLDAVAAALGCEAPEAPARVAAIITDTRQLQPGDLFVALCGERFDGHDYLAQAREAGAIAAVVSRPVDDPLAQLLVADTRLALGLLGQARRRAWGGPLAAITGNSGKTTVKALLAAIFERRGSTLATHGNLNNDIGAPLTLLRLERSHRQAVVELGANHLGEIAWTSMLARPQVVVITNVTGAHVGEFGGMGRIAQAKAEILAGLSGDGTAVLNRDDAFFPFWRALVAEARIIDFGLTESARVNARDLVCDCRGRYAFTLVFAGQALGRVQLQLMGLHNVRNALAAAAAALALGAAEADVLAGLQGVVATPGRLMMSEGIRDCRLLDDTYNANPGAVKAALDTLATLPAPRWCFLGAIGELGDESAAWHADVGRYARSLEIDFLGTLGAEAEPAARAFGVNGCHFADWEALLRHAHEHLPVGASVLIKGSRSAGMERLVADLRADTPR